MIVLSAKNLTKAFGTEVVLDNVSFHVNQGDRVGIIGANGAGKTTLLNILTGESGFDEGDFFIAPELARGYLKQSGGFDPESTVGEEMLRVFSELTDMESEMERLSQEIALAARQGEEAGRLLDAYDKVSEVYRARGGFGFRSEINGVLSSMAFGEAEIGKKTGLLSGGERTRLALAALLLRKPGLLLLDEPTNHLDIGTLSWLEQYLKNYVGTVVLISHDRYFLDQTVNRIFEMENHRLSVYEGNYSTFLEKKRAGAEAEYGRYERQQQEIKRQEEMIRRFKQHGTEKLANRAKSREKLLERVTRLEKPTRPGEGMKLAFRQKFKSGHDALHAEGLAKGFGRPPERRELFRGVDLDLKSGEHVCMVGANGVGKTTLLRIVTGDEVPDEGWLRLGHNTLIGYYDQEQEGLDRDKTVLDEMTGSFRGYSDTQMRSMLGAFLFSGDAAFQRISTLSGGERARLSLLKLMLSGANLLLLDEPTNHLDIVSKELFEEALEAFPGTALIISHDRYLLRRIPSRIVELTAEGLVGYLGNYDYYLEKKESLGSGKRYLSEMAASRAGGGEGGSSEEVGAGAGSWSAAAELRARNKEAQKERRRRERELAALEARIGELEEEIKEVEGLMTAEEALSDHVLLAAHDERLRALKPELAALYEAWVAKQEEAAAEGGEDGEGGG
jgi:ATP-binding cassette subfamily F protein 3